MQCHQNVLLENGPHPNRLNQPVLHIPAARHTCHCTFDVQNPAGYQLISYTDFGPCWWIMSANCWWTVNFFSLLLRNYTTSSLLGTATTQQWRLHPWQAWARLNSIHIVRKWEAIQKPSRNKPNQEGRKPSTAVYSSKIFTQKTQKHASPITDLPVFNRFPGFPPV